MFKQKNLQRADPFQKEDKTDSDIVASPGSVYIFFKCLMMAVTKCCKPCSFFLLRIVYNIYK